MTERLRYFLTGNPPPADSARYYEYQEFIYDYETISVAKFPLAGIPGIERFLPLLPVSQIPSFFARGVGNTPISQLGNIGKVLGLENLWVKHEEVNPTGCSKDRESVLVISAALENGVRKVVIASSGNAALSTAAYAQKAGIECICYVPEKTSEEKKNLIRLSGARLIAIPGFYEDVYRYVVDTKPEGWNVTAGQNPIRTEGNKTIAYELWEQLGVPEIILTPSGNGTCLVGIWKGFTELRRLGKINRLPQMVSVQIKGAAPLKTALAQAKDFVVLGDIEDSIAEGIVAQESYCSPKAIRALQESGGYVIEVTDQEIVDALGNIIRTELIVPEPTSAAVYAALPKLKTANPQSLVVTINTGSGMKCLPEIMQLLSQ